MHRVPKRHYCDFRVYYATAERFIDKEDIYSRPDESITPFKYSTLFAMLISPLSFFSIKAASLIFFTINFVSLLAIFVFSKRLIAQDKISFRQSVFLYIFSLICSFRFILHSLDAGQISIIMFLLVILGLYFLEKSRDIIGAALLGLAIMFKYTPAVFLPYFIFRKKIKAVALVMIFIMFYCIIPAAYVGINTQIDYLKNWLPFISETSLDQGSCYDYKNQSLFSLVLRYFTADSPYKVSIASLSFNRGLIVAFIVSIIIYSLIIFPGSSQNSHNPTEYSLLFICMALFNPNAWMHNFVICIFVYMAIFYYLLKVNFKDSLTIILLLFSFVLMSCGAESLVGNNLENILEELSSVTIGGLFLALLLFRLKFKRLII